MTGPARIGASVEPDGAVMLNAAELVAWLHTNAHAYGTGRAGGSRAARRAAAEAIDTLAESLQWAYIDAATDQVADSWGPTP